MPPIFNMERREQIKTDLLEKGTKLIYENGIRKLSIQKLTNETGIGKGTFYHFFDSKENYISALLHYGKEDIYRYLNCVIEQKGHLDKEAFLEFFQQYSWNNPVNLALHLSEDDKEWIRVHLNQEFGVDTENEHQIMRKLFDNNPNVKKDVDYRVIFNMMRIIGTMPQLTRDLYMDAVNENYRLLYQSLADYIFK